MDPKQQRELKVGGPLDQRDNVYITRRVDGEFLKLLRRGEYVNVVTSRQMGKTSLVYRAMADLALEGYHFGYFDLSHLRNEPQARRYFQTLLDELARDLNLDVDLDDFWAGSEQWTNGQVFINFFRLVLRVLKGKVVIVLDEIDSTLESPHLSFTDDIFTSIRSLYTARPREPDLKRLVFCLVGVATPNELIKAPRTTPYNIARTLWLEDFDGRRDDLTELAGMLASDPMTGAAILERILYWTGGQPYLTMWICDELRRAESANSQSVDALVHESYTSLDRLRGDIHFEQVQRFLGERPSGGTDAVDIYARVLEFGDVVDQPANPAYALLRLSGLVKRGRDGLLTVRSPIYRRIFGQDWVRRSRPNRLTVLVGGSVFRDGDTCPEMVVIPTGRFLMGSAHQKAEYPEEGPVHTVMITRGFAISKFPITFDEWDSCVADGGCAHIPRDEGWGRGRQPVVNVSWEDAQAYVGWLSSKTGKGYRLLSESEWEYVARDGTTTLYPWGDEPSTNQANFDGSGSRWSDRRTAPVGSFNPNSFGLYDMIGNVWEWTADCWNDSYQGAPDEGSAWITGDCSLRVVRGGSWSSNPENARVTFRRRYDRKFRFNNIGFRVARTL